MRCASLGPRDARIVIVGEAPGKDEEIRGIPFVGRSGEELDRMLSDAGIAREACFVTNAVKERPDGNKLSLWINKKKTPEEGQVRFRNRWVRPNVQQDVEELHADLRAINPRVIIPLGSSALWAVTSYDSVDKWRGSYLRSDIPGVDGVVVPTYHPAGVLRKYDWRYITVRDLRRAAAASREGPPSQPRWNFEACSDFAAAERVVRGLLAKVEATPQGFPVVCDLEIKRKEIVCLGLGWSKVDAACIAFYNYQGRTMTQEETAKIWWMLWELFHHPNCRLVNQNIMFDIQFTFENGGVWPPAWFDTMLAQHVIFPGEPKALDYLASLYCEYYVYWKDDGKFWDKPIIFEQLWHYNCLDCVYTYEVMEVQIGVLKQLKLRPQLDFLMQRLMPRTLQTMFRGIRVDERKRKPLLAEIEELVGRRVKVGSKTVHEKYGRFEHEVNFMAGKEVDAFSWKQLQDFFYGRMGIKPILRREMIDGKPVMKPTTDDDAMVEIGKREPLLAPIAERINLIRSYNTAASVCKARASEDGRWRCSFNIGGTENYRFSSDKNPWGEGTNLQNLTLGKEIK